MELQTFGDPAERPVQRDLRGGKDAKFAIFSGRQETKTYVANLFSWAQSHEMQVRHVLGQLPDFDFVGAGKIFGERTRLHNPDKPKLCWGSDTCEAAFGFDRPADPTLEQRLLDELKTLLMS